MATHYSTLAWKIPWMEEPGRLQSMGSRRVGLDWTTSLSLFTFMHWRRKWQSTPVLLPGESQGREPGGLPSMGLHRVGHDWHELAASSCYGYHMLWWANVNWDVDRSRSRCGVLRCWAITECIPLYRSHQGAPEVTEQRHLPLGWVSTTGAASCV